MTTDWNANKLIDVKARDKATGNKPHDPSENKLRDIDAIEITGVQIGTFGHKLWVCVDGECVLRVRSPEISLDDMRLEDPHDCDSGVKWEGE